MIDLKVAAKKVVEQGLARTEGEAVKVIKNVLRKLRLNLLRQGRFDMASLEDEQLLEIGAKAAR